MKALRATALGLVVGLCLLTATPAALADGGWNPGVRAVVERPGGWLPGWMLQIAEWLGWEEPSERASAPPRAIVEEQESSTAPSGSPTPSPTANCDHGSTMDPGGAPCTP
jgi:hypothetical protein